MVDPPRASGDGNALSRSNPGFKVKAGQLLDDGSFNIFNLGGIHHLANTVHFGKVHCRAGS